MSTSVFYTEETELIKRTLTQKLLLIVIISVNHLHDFQCSCFNLLYVLSHFISHIVLKKS